MGDLVVYGGSGQAARSWDAYHRIVASLRSLESDETLLVQCGKAVGIRKTHPYAPRVLIANAMLVPAWGDWEHFRKYEALGLTMYGCACGSSGGPASDNARSGVSI